MPKTTKETINKKSNKASSKNTLTSTTQTKVSNAKIKKNSTVTVQNIKSTKLQNKSNVKSDKIQNKSNVKKSSTKNTPSKKKTSKKVTKNAKTIKTHIDLLEYYDLPYRYNKTIVKILAQTPKTLFVYWDISDEDRNSYIKEYGENFFENTKPVLIIHNLTMNYTFEIEINDFANCWYFNIQDEKCEYAVELGRRSKSNIITIPNNYLLITSSNKIESPNGHVLFEQNKNTIYYRNVKTNETSSKNITNLEFIKYIGKIYNLNSLYKKMYKDEIWTNIDNPSSH